MKSNCTILTTEAADVPQSDRKYYRRKYKWKSMYAAYADMFMTQQ